MLVFLMLHGSEAHSRYMGEGIYDLLQGDNKELVIVEGATHCDLYNGGEKGFIPFDRI